MSSRPILSRPRTRIYDSNYNIGESYYKSALDRLDRKYSDRPLSPPPRNDFADVAERHARAFADDDLETSRRRAESKIKERHLFDSRGGLIAQRSSDFVENGISEETASTLQRIRASKRVALVNDIDMESTSNNLRTQRMLDRSEKILDSIGISDSSSRRSALEDDFSYKKRNQKVTFDTDVDNLTKWSAIEDRESSSSAVARARQSRARIDDIDEEMASMQQKQEARERRVARLKALVAECESETVDDSGVARRF